MPTLTVSSKGQIVLPAGTRRRRGLVEFETIEDRTRVLAAMDALESGMDFADALHVLRHSQASHFATFDRGLGRRGQKLKYDPPIELLR